MTTLAQLLYVFGALIAGWGGLWILTLAWKRGILWCLGCAFVPGVMILYAVLYWYEAKDAFIWSLVGGFIMGFARIALS